MKHDVTSLIKRQNRKEPSEQIHAVWYCVNSQVTRETEIDHQWIARLAKEIPVLAVITRVSGVEKDWLQPHLEQTTTVRRVVPVMAKKENIIPHPIEPYGLDTLLAATEDLLEEIAQRATINAVNGKADEAYAWCRDGYAKVATAQLLPIPLLKLATSPIQTQRMFGNTEREEKGSGKWEHFENQDSPLLECSGDWPRFSPIVPDGRESASNCHHRATCGSSSTRLSMVDIPWATTARHNH